MVWDRPKEVNGTPTYPLHPPSSGWHLVVDPQYPLPPAPLGTVLVRSWFKGQDRDTGEWLLGTGWEGDHVSIYAFPFPEKIPYPGLWPNKGTDPSVRECLGQAAYLLGEGPVHPEGYLDFLFTFPEMATIGGKHVKLLDVAGPGELQLFAVTDRGDFGVGPRVSLAEPYKLTVTPGTAQPGDTVVIEGEGLKPEGAVVSVLTALGVRWNGGTGAKLEIARVQILDGRIRVEWTTPKTARVATAPPSLKPTPTPTGTPPSDAPTPTPTPGLVDAQVKVPQIVPIGIYPADAGPRSLYQTILFLGLEGRTQKTGP